MSAMGERERAVHARTAVELSEVKAAFRELWSAVRTGDGVHGHLLTCSGCSASIHRGPMGSALAHADRIFARPAASS